MTTVDGTQDGISIEQVGVFLAKQGFTWKSYYAEWRPARPLLWWDGKNELADVELPLERVFFPERVDWGGFAGHVGRNSIVLTTTIDRPWLFGVIRDVQRMKGHHSPFDGDEFGEWVLLAQPLNWRKHVLSGHQEQAMGEDEVVGVEVLRWSVVGLEWKPSETVHRVLAAARDDGMETPGCYDIDLPEPAHRLASGQGINYICAALEGKPLVSEPPPVVDLGPAGSTESIRWFQCRRCHKYLDLLIDGEIVSPDRVVCPCGADDPMTVEPIDDPYFNPAYERVPAVVPPILDPQMKDCIKEAIAIVDETSLFPDWGNEESPTWPRGLAAAILAVGIRHGLSMYSGCGDPRIVKE